MAVLSNANNPAQPLSVASVMAAARPLGVQRQLREARRPDEFERVFAAVVKEHAGALLVVLDPVLFVHRARLVELAARNRLPSMATQALGVETGGLMSYGPHLPDPYRRAAT